MRLISVIPLFIILRAEILADYKHLRCSVCELMSDEFEKRISHVRKQTYQTTHRLSAKNKILRNSMIGSELATIEVLDGFCASLGNCTLKYSEAKGHRIFSSDTKLPAGQLYSPRDRQAIGGLWENGCRNICEEVLEKYEDEIDDFIRTGKTGKDYFCHETVRMCNDESIAAHISMERKDTAKKRSMEQDL